MPSISPRRPIIAALLLAFLAGVQPARASSAGDARHGARGARGAVRTVYVALGASDTVGVGAANPARDNWTAQLARHLPHGSRYVNLGRSGATLEDALRAELPAALKARPTLATVWLAVNDLNALVSPEDYGAQLDRLLAALRKAGARVYVGNVPDLALVPAYRDQDYIPVDQLDGIVRDYNKTIAATCARRGATVVDLYAASVPALKNLKNVGRDGFHPSTRGYALLADLFYRAMHRQRAI